MTCPTCGAPCASDAAFCRECGTHLELACPGCGALGEDGRFCGRCGTRLLDAGLLDAGLLDAGLLDAGAASEVARPGRTERLPDNGPTAPVAERRLTSVLFADLVGFTTFSEARDAEEVREMLSAYFTRCRAAIDRHGGVVEKFIGDAVMAVWGVPVAREDDAERAVAAGLELTTAVAALGLEIGASLAVRVGIVTGEVAVTVGATAEGMVAGDPVNTAARVQSAATPGQVWVNDATRALVGSAMSFADAGTHELKGKAQRVRLWRARPDGEADDAPELLHAALVGRDDEMQRLLAAFDGALVGRPRLVLLNGDAGVGKSRLVHELQDRLQAPEHEVLWHRGRCLSYGEGMAFRALADAVRARLGVVESDGGQVVALAIDVGLRRYVDDERERAWLAPRLGTLLGTSQERRFDRADLFAAWTAFLRAVAAQGDALVLVVDDAHHADDGLLDFLEHLTSHDDLRVLVVATARPELLAHHPELRRPGVDEIDVQPLDDDEMRRLLDGLVTGLDESAYDEIVARADGIPLFAVETVRALIDRDLVTEGPNGATAVPGVSVDIEALGPPVALHALVAARLDALRPDEKRLVADASVLGKSFTIDALTSLGWGATSAGETLASLADKEVVLLQTDRFTSEREQWRFVQGVVQQVAYGMQSRRDRKARHLRVAAHLASLPDLSDDLAVVQATHLLAAVDASLSGDKDVAELTIDACSCLARAGDRARRLGAPTDAERLFRMALERDPGEPHETSLRFALAGACNEAGHYLAACEESRLALAGAVALHDEVLAGLATAEEVLGLVSLGDNAGALAVGVPWWERLQDAPDAELALDRLARNLGSASMSLGDSEGQAYYARRRIEMARATGDMRSLASAYLQLGLNHLHTGDPERALVLVRQGAGIAREHHIPEGHAYAMLLLGTLTKSRDLDAAVEYAHEAREVAHRTGRRFYLDYAIANVVQALWSRPDLPGAREILDELFDDATEPEVISWLPALDLWLCDADGGEPRSAPDAAPTDSRTVLAWRGSADVQRLLRSGEMRRAVEVAEETLAHVVDAMGLDDDFILLWPPLVRAALDAGDGSAAHRLLRPVSDAEPAAVSRGVEAHYRSLRGAAAALGAVPDIDPAVELRDAIDALTAFGARGAAARSIEDLARWLSAQGQDDEAYELRERARSEYAELRAHGWLARLESVIDTRRLTSTEARPQD